MKEHEKKQYLEKYKQAKERGVPFFPDIIFKDAVVSLLVFALLVGLAFFVGAPVEDRANPSDTTYTPRPEWYFLFLFQMLKYFPGQLEVIGGIILPGLVVLGLLALPLVDRSPKRHYRKRPLATLAAVVGIGAVALLTVLAVREPPPPQAARIVDQAAALYSTNCANCHGATIDTPAAADLHQIIAAGQHEGMPAWGGDLSTDEIDALAGFILAPDGSEVYARECGTCHEQAPKAIGNPVEIGRVLDQGAEYAGHVGLSVPRWRDVLSAAEQNALSNFLAAPDGQRLFTINCAGCHGEGVAFAGNRDELQRLVSEGGQHLDMPAWDETLTTDEINAVASYVVFPRADNDGEALFGRYCADCHGDRIPYAPDNEIARNIIRTGGPHVSMPRWGEILTPEQLEALVDYTYEAGRGAGPAAGARLFSENCAGCHGVLGQGGPNPTRTGDIIAPISSPEYLRTRDDDTLRSIISQGQPDFGMSPFADTSGGPLTADQIDAVVAFVRAWESNPPVELPPEVTLVPSPTWSSAQIYTLVCASCHGPAGEGGIGPALTTPDFQERVSEQMLIETITAGHTDTSMIAWGEVLTPDQISDLAKYVGALGGATATASPSYAGDVAPLLQLHCQACHNSTTALGGWDASTYESVVSSGDHGPAVVAGDVAKSLLAQRLQGVAGSIMPPSGSLDPAALQLILNWLAAGAQNN